MEKQQLRDHVTSRDTWMRGLYILLFAVAYSVAELVLVVIVAYQFLARLFTGGINERLQRFGQQLSTWLYEVLRFFTFNSDVRPYPFAPWPKGVPEPPARPARKKATRKKRAPARAAKGPDEGAAGGDDTAGGASSGES